MGGFLGEPERCPPAARGLPSLLALASRCGLELPEARQRAGVCPLRAAPLWASSRLGPPPGSTPSGALSSPLSSVPWPPPWCGLSHISGLAAAPGSRPDFPHRRRHPIARYGPQLRASQLSSPCRPPAPSTPLPIGHFSETQTERSPGGFLPQTTRACFPRRY